jgi:hypothetical protein
MEIVLKNISDILHPGSYPADAWGFFSGSKCGHLVI